MISMGIALEIEANETGTEVEEVKFSPIEKLLQAVLMLGLDDFFNTKKWTCKANSRLSVQNQADIWLFSSNMQHPFTFLRICEYFGYNPEHIRGAAVKKRDELARNPGGGKKMKIIKNQTGVVTIAILVIAAHFWLGVWIIHWAKKDYQREQAKPVQVCQIQKAGDPNDSTQTGK